MSTFTDPEADKKYDPEHVKAAEDAATEQSRYDREFAGITGDNYNETGENPKNQVDGNKKVDDAESLKDKEEETPDRSGYSAGDDINEKLGKGYSGKGSTKSKSLSKLYGGNSNFNKKIAIAGAVAGGSVIGGILVFFALLPLKIEHIVTNLENKFSATSQNAMTSETGNLYSNFIREKVLPNLGKGVCHSTVDASCVSGTTGNDPISKLYNAWKQGNLEQKMAQKYNVVIGKSGNQLYMNLDGNFYDSPENMNKDLQDVQAGRKSMFDIGNSTGSGRASRTEIRAALNDSLKGATLWDKTYFRFKVNQLLASKYGIKHCVIACKIQDKFADAVSDKKLAAKAYLIQRVISPASENYSLIMQCVLADADFCNTALDPAKANDAEELSPFQKKLQAQLDAFAEKYSEKALKDLVSTAQDISKDGFQRVAAREVARKIVSTFSGDSAGEAAGAAAEKAVPVVGWVLTAGKVVSTAQKIGPTIRYMSYATSAAAAVGLYASYRTVASEMKSGNVDPTELGSFTTALSTNLSGSSSDQVDASQTPLYGSLFGAPTSTSTSILNDLLPGNAYADATQSNYTCDSGSGVPNGSLICPEEKLDRGNDIANQISAFASSIPGIGEVASLINKVGAIFGTATSAVFNGLCSTIGQPECPAALNYVSSLAGGLFSWLENKLIVTPFSDNMSGGRTFDMMAAGADVTNNASCQQGLGCGVVSNTVVADQQNEQTNSERSQFDAMPMFARIFDTNSSYSLVSKLAMGMPTTLVGSSTASVATLFTDPLTRLIGGFSSMFSGNNAFAATAPQEDPFGVVQYGYTDADIPTDPQAYWTANCVNGPMGVYNDSTGQLDVSAWLNANQTQDPNTGEATNTKPNPCLLIQASVQSAGGLFDTSLLPLDSTNSDSSSGTPAASGDAATLAQQILANPNITLEKSCVTGATVTPSGCAYQDILATSQGQTVTPGMIEGQSNGTASTTACTARTPVTLDPMLLQAMLVIASQYKYTIHDITSGHDCDSGRHPLGRAFDIFSVNGVNISGNCSSMQAFGQSAMNVLAQLKPTGSGRTRNGFGSCDQNLLTGIPGNINYFFDSPDEIHLDTGFAS